MSSVPMKPPRCEALIQPVSSEEGSVISKAPSRLRPKDDENDGDKAVDPRIRSELHDAERAQVRRSPAVRGRRTAR